MLENTLLIALIALSVWMLTVKKRFNLILGMSAFSLLVAALYAYYSALDVALAEVAVGSAIVPIIFVIATSHQRKFFVYVDGGISEKAFETRCKPVLESFCENQGLKLIICKPENKVHFKDVWVHSKDENFLFEGQSHNKLVTRLAKYCVKCDFISFERRDINEAE